MKLAELLWNSQPVMVTLPSFRTPPPASKSGPGPGADPPVITRPLSVTSLPAAIENTRLAPWASIVAGPPSDSIVSAPASLIVNSPSVSV